MELKKYKLGDIAEILVSSIDKKSKDGEPSVRLRSDCRETPKKFSTFLTS